MNTSDLVIMVFFYLSKYQYQRASIIFSVFKKWNGDFKRLQQSIGYDPCYKFGIILSSAFDISAT
jgi:hypothetical protein